MASGVWGPPPVRKQSPQLLREEDRVQNGGRNPGKEHVFLLHREWRKNKYQISVKYFTCFLLQRELWNNGASWAVSLTGWGGESKRPWMSKDSVINQLTYYCICICIIPHA